MAVETTLQLSQQPASLDKGNMVKIDVTTNAVTYEVVLDNDNLHIADKEVGSFKLVADKTGLTKVDVKATAEGGSEKIITWYINIVIIPTELTVNDKPTEMEVGKEYTLDINTNATDYSIDFTDRQVLRVGSSSNKIVAIGLGKSKIIVSAKKLNAETVTVEWEVNVKYIKPVKPDGNPVNIKLINTSTRRTVSLITSDNTSTNDITIKLPKRSGTLVTEESLQEQNKLITTPFIITPATGTDDYRGEFLGSPFEAGMGYNGNHIKTVWQLAKDSKFTEIIFTKTVTKESGADRLTKSCLNDVGTGTYYVRVKYQTEDFESAWSPSIYVGLGVAHADDNKTPIKIYNHPKSGEWSAPTGLSKIRDLQYGAYYGKVEHNNLVDDYDYRGTFNTIKNAFKKERYSTPDTANKLIWMKKGYQVIHDGKLWHALQTMENADKDSMIVPGESSSYWSVDERTNLGTPRLVCDQVGIGFGVVDNNHNGMSSGKNAIDPLVNHTEGYLKYIYNGKLCYTTPKPICNGIAWTDLAQRELCHRERTIRLGKYLYWVRLMDEAEYEELFGRLMDGTYDKKSISDFELDKKIWVNDKQTGSARNVMSYATPVAVKGSAILGNTVGEVTAPTASEKATIKLNNNYTKIKVGEEVNLDITVGNGASQWKPLIEDLAMDDELCVAFLKYNTTHLDSDGDSERRIETRSDTGMLQEYNGKIVGGKPGRNTIKIVTAKDPDTIEEGSASYTEITYVVEVVEDKPVVNKSTLDPKSRTGALRLVLEYIEEGCAPYKQYEQYYNTTIPKADNEEFRYDPYSDVGFYGIVPVDKIMGGNALSAACGFTSGSAQHDAMGYLKFYWHGMIIYIAKKPIRYNVSWNSIKQHNCQYGWDMGSNDSKFVTAHNNRYRVANMLGARQSPYDHTKTTYPSQNKLHVNNILSENGRYSQNSECLARLAPSYVGYEEEPNVHYASNYLDQVSFVQCGDAFQKMTTSDLCRRYDIDGNGTAEYAREVGSGNYSIHLGFYGFGRWEGHYALTFANTHTSWRPVLYAERHSRV